MSEPVLRPVDPATGAVLPEVPCTPVSEVAATVARARAAQVDWATRPFEARAEAVRRFTAKLAAPEVRSRVETCIRREMGKPVRQAAAEIDNVLRRTPSFVEAARAAWAAEEGVEGSIAVLTQWRPLGVVAVIAPWNFPFSTPHNLVVSALLTGNAAVLKPSEFTPATGALYRELMAAELPAELFGLVQGAGEVGRALVEADVDMIAFTGSIATGQAIMRSAAAGMKRLVLELGGKDPMVVLPGADVEAAARHAVSAALGNSGQVCVAAERILVHRDLHDRFVARVLELVGALVVGDPADPSTDLGPLANARQREIVLEQLADARRRGARILLEGRAHEPGFWLTPSVVDGVTPDMTLAREETFGPVVAIETYDDVEAAIARANDGRYGLGASVFGPPGPETDAVGDRIEAGMVGINRGLSAAAGAPWVGWKLSGFGYSRSVGGMRQFMQPKTRAHTIAPRP